MQAWANRRTRQKERNPKLGDLHLPLTMAVRMWEEAVAALPKGSTWTWASLPDLILRHGGRMDRNARLLNPAFVERLMGFPPGWTDASSSATQSYRSWLHTHSEHLKAILN